jgi:hypothetical protein
VVGQDERQGGVVAHRHPLAAAVVSEVRSGRAADV